MRKYQEMSRTKADAFELLPPNKKIRTDSHSLSGEICTPLPAPSNDLQSSQNSTHQKPVEILAKFLRALYGRSKLPMYGKWPPSPSKQFINMAVIRKEKVSCALVDKFTKATLRGTRDDILRTKKKIDFKHLAKMKDDEPVQLILVEGAPGIGKSTFAWEACRRWGVGKILQQYKLMVLLRLREKRVQQAKTIADLFYFSCDIQVKKKAIAEIESTHGAGLLLIFEGFDELPAVLREEDSLFIQIIKGERLCDATILVTSRHWASRPLLANDELHRPLSQHIEILGFTRQDIEEYLKCMTSDDDPSVLQGLNEYLSCYPNISSMMYVPLNCAIVLEVYRESRSGEHQLVPKTMTELYKSLVRTLLIRYLTDYPEHRNKYKKLVSFSDLPDSVYEQLRKVANIAYEGICNDEQIIFSDLPDGFETLGLMQCVPELYVDQGAVVSYNFLHLTLQEFMAAFHVSLMTSNMQIEHFNSINYSSMLLAFTAGLTKLNYNKEQLVTFISEFITSGVDIKILHWLFEAQNAKFLQDVCSDAQFLQDVCSDSLEFDDENLYTGPFDYYILGYCVLQSNCNWKIYFVEFIAEELEMFVRGTCTANTTEERCGKIISLKMKCGEYNSIPTALTNLPTCLLSELVTIHFSFVEDGWNNLASLVQNCPQLHELSLEDCIFQQGSAIQLFESLSSLHHFVSLKITCYCNDDDLDTNTAKELHLEEWQALCTLLSKSQSLTKLTIGFYSSVCNSKHQTVDGPSENDSLELLSSSSSELYVSDGVQSLSLILQTNNSLLQLSLICNEIDSSGAKCIADTLSKNNTLKELCMIKNLVEDDGAKALAEMLLRNTSLTLLDLGECSITEVGASHLARALCVNSCLGILNLKENNVRDQGAITLAQMLTRNHSLKKLELGNCSITEVGVGHLAQALCVNSFLETIKLSHNTIKDQGAIALAQMLTRNHSLKILKLRDCSVTEVGVSQLAQALYDNHRRPSLETIKLSYNNIKDQGAIALAQMLTRNHSLKILNLRDCSVTEVGVSRLLQALHVNSSVETINLSHNTIEDQSAIIFLTPMLTRHQSLKEIKLEGCSISITNIRPYSVELETNLSIT